MNTIDRRRQNTCPSCSVCSVCPVFFVFSELKPIKEPISRPTSSSKGCHRLPTPTSSIHGTLQKNLATRKSHQNIPIIWLLLTEERLNRRHLPHNPCMERRPRRPQAAIKGEAILLKKGFRPLLLLPFSSSYSPFPSSDLFFFSLSFF